MKKLITLEPVTSSIVLQKVLQNAGEFRHLLPAPASQRFKVQYRDPRTDEWIGTQTMEDVRFSENKITEETDAVVFDLTYVVHGEVHTRINRKRKARLQKQARRKKK